MVYRYMYKYTREARGNRGAARRMNRRRKRARFVVDTGEPKRGLGVRRRKEKGNSTCGGGTAGGRRGFVQALLGKAPTVLEPLTPPLELGSRQREPSFLPPPLQHSLRARVKLLRAGPSPSESLYCRHDAAVLRSSAKGAGVPWPSLRVSILSFQHARRHGNPLGRKPGLFETITGAQFYSGSPSLSIVPPLTLPYGRKHPASSQPPRTIGLRSFFQIKFYNAPFHLAVSRNYFQIKPFPSIFLLFQLRRNIISLVFFYLHL